MGLFDMIVSELKNVLLPINSHNNSRISMNNAATQENVDFPNWYISISFGKSTSNNYDKAVALAKSAPQYHEQIDDGKILHQAIYSSNPNEFLAFVMLYELVGSWKSSFVFINGEMIDRKIIGKLNYCYGDKCRSCNPKFCYGASYMTENPFGCHRIQISACNNPWWEYFYKSGNKWILDKNAIKQKIDMASNMYSICPCFDYQRIISNLNALPNTMTNKQFEALRRNGYGLRL